MRALKLWEVMLLVVMTVAIFVFGYTTGKHFTEMDAYRMASSLGLKATEGEPQAVKACDALRAMQPALDHTGLWRHFYQVLQIYDQRPPVPQQSDVGERGTSGR